jgi:hypothetical protein
MERIYAITRSMECRERNEQAAHREQNQSTPQDAIATSDAPANRPGGDEANDRARRSRGVLERQRDGEDALQRQPERKVNHRSGFNLTTVGLTTGLRWHLFGRADRTWYIPYAD